MLNRVFVLGLLLAVLLAGAASGQSSLIDQGQWSANRFGQNSVASPSGTDGSPYAADGVVAGSCLLRGRRAAGHRAYLRADERVRTQ
jgi:hypothetical protein